MPKNQANRISDLLATVNADLIADLPQQLEDNTLRVERLLLDLVRPDPVQPRRVLPETIHFAFHNNRLSPTQSLRELVQLVQVTARQRGRPFNHVLELLPNAEEGREDEAETKLSPEEQLLRDLVNLAITIRDDGQVNPLTVVDMTQGVTRLYRIETGERRYWATWLLRDFIPAYEGDGMIPCIIIPTERSSVFRQAKENTARSGLSAIAMARQAALLLLTVHGYEIPNEAVSNDFYRQALDLDLRGKREHTVAVLSAMGGLSKQDFGKYKSLLSLCDEAMDLADRHSVDLWKLWYVAMLGSPEDQVELLQQVIQMNLTVKQIRDLIDKGSDVTTNLDDISRSLPRAAIQMAKWALKPDKEVNGQRLAEAALNIEHDRAVAKARLRALCEMLEEAEHYLDDR